MALDEVSSLEVGESLKQERRGKKEKKKKKASLGKLAAIENFLCSLGSSTRLLNVCSVQV